MSKEELNKRYTELCQVLGHLQATMESQKADIMRQIYALSSQMEQLEQQQADESPKEENASQE
jgi:hypothetical protein